MNFFEAQEQARKKTAVLVALFMAAVLCLIALTNLILLAAMALFPLQVSSFGVQLTGFSWSLLLTTSVIVILVVGMAILWKFLRLRKGGFVVAQSLGGRPILPNTTQPQERRVLNVVEEMALASGMPVPRVYLLPHEAGINAFAAGHSASDAVIGVTQGCIEQLSREELQGVIAHEFSHIHNGDMRLNMKLVAILFGLLFIGQAGALLLRGSSGRSGLGGRQSDGRAVVVMLGVGAGLVFIGWLGTFFGGMIKAAVSRQREFLADASAAQFTRQPAGLASALKRIGGYTAGSRVADGHAEELSHLFFANALKRARSLRATHPPLAQRILRLEPNWDGQFPVVRAPATSSSSAETSAQHSAAFLSTAAGGPTGTQTNNTADASPFTPAPFSPESLPQFEKLSRIAHEPFGATTLCYALLLHSDPQIRRKQAQYLQSNTPEGTLTETTTIQPLLQQLGEKGRLPLLELCIASLRSLSATQYQAFKRTLLFLVKADGQISVFEWCVFQLIRHYLDGAFGLRKGTTHKFKNPLEIIEEFTIVLSLFVHQSQQSMEEKNKAFAIGANVAGLYTARLLNQEAVSIEAFTQALSRLACCYPLLKERLLKGLIRSVRFDGNITVVEKELITSIAAVIDLPLPEDALAGLNLK